MSTLTDSSMPDPDEPTFDPGLDVAILVFSHVEHVKTRLNLAQVSKLWLQASKPAAAYPSRFDLSKLRRVTRIAYHGDRYSWRSHVIQWQPTLHRDIARLMDNDGVLSLPCDRVFQLLRESFSIHCHLFLPSHCGFFRYPRTAYPAKGPLNHVSFENLPMWLCQYGFETGRVRLIKLGSSGRFHNLLK